MEAMTQKEFDQNVKRDCEKCKHRLECLADADHLAKVCYGELEQVIRFLGSRG